MIGISTTTQNTSGDMVIYEKATSELKRFDARVSRVRTLDGGVVLIHGGATYVDATLQVRGEITAADESKLRAIYTGETTIYVSTEIGFFEGAISMLIADGGNLTMNIMLKESLS